MKVRIDLPGVICCEAECAASTPVITLSQFHASLKRAPPETAMGKG